MHAFPNSCPRFRSCFSSRSNLRSSSRYPCLTFSVFSRLAVQGAVHAMHKTLKKCSLGEKNIICKGFLFTCGAPLAFIHFVQPVHNLWHPLPALCCPTLFLNGNSQLSRPCITSSHMATSISIANLQNNSQRSFCLMPYPPFWQLTNCCCYHNYNCCYNCWRVLMMM